jgi:acyl-CoA thioesterase YciA
MSENPEIEGELALQTLAMPKDTNANGDIFGGWLVSQMDLAAGIISKQVTGGRSATVAIENVSFLSPVKVGATVSRYCRVEKRPHLCAYCGGRLSWQRVNQSDGIKVADGLFVFVAIDDSGKPRPLPEA